MIRHLRYLSTLPAIANFIEQIDTEIVTCAIAQEIHCTTSTPFVNNTGKKMDAQTDQQSLESEDSKQDSVLISVDQFQDLCTLGDSLREVFNMAMAGSRRHVGLERVVKNEFMSALKTIVQTTSQFTSRSAASKGLYIFFSVIECLPHILCAPGNEFITWTQVLHALMESFHLWVQFRALALNPSDPPKKAEASVLSLYQAVKGGSLALSSDHSEEKCKHGQKETKDLLSLDLKTNVDGQVVESDYDDEFECDSEEKSETESTNYIEETKNDELKTEKNAMPFHTNQGASNLVFHIQKWVSADTWENLTLQLEKLVSQRPGVIILYQFFLLLN